MALTKVRGDGAEGLTLSSTALTVANGLTLTDGDIALASGHGVSFASTSDGSSSMTSELLDDYEEGTWTPVASSGSLTVLRCTYTKVGNVVHISGQLNDITDTGTAANVEISGLPYTSASDQQSTGGVMFRYLNAPSDGTQLTALMNPSQTKIVFYWSFDDGANWFNLQYQHATTTWDMIFNISYKTAT